MRRRRRPKGKGYPVEEHPILSWVESQSAALPMKLYDQALALFMRNPMAWLLAALCICVVYANYALGSQLTKVCSLIWEPLEWDAVRSTSGDRLTAFKARTAQLETEDSVEGKLWRWQHEAGRRIGKICSERENFPGD